MNLKGTKLKSLLAIEPAIDDPMQGVTNATNADNLSATVDDLQAQHKNL